MMQFPKRQITLFIGLGSFLIILFSIYHIENLKSKLNYFESKSNDEIPNYSIHFQAITRHAHLATQQQHCKNLSRAAKSFTP